MLHPTVMMFCVMCEDFLILIYPWSMEQVNPLCAIFQKEHKHMFIFYVIPPH